MRRFVFYAALLLFPLVSVAQFPPLYVFLSNVDRAATEEKINEHAGQGYRLAGLQVLGWREPLNIVVVMEALPESDNRRYEYKLLEGAWITGVHDKSPLGEQVIAAGVQGYRIVRGTLLLNLPDGYGTQWNDKALAMERIIGSSERIEYRHNRAAIMKHTLANVQAAVHDGFEPLLLFNHGDRLLVSEKAPDTVALLDPGAPQKESAGEKFWGNTFTWTGLNRNHGVRAIDIVEVEPKHMEEDLAAWNREGKHIVTLATKSLDGSYVVTLATLPGSKPGMQVSSEGVAGRQMTIPTMEAWTNFERDLNAAAAKGYAIAVRPTVQGRSNFSGSRYTTRIFAVLEATEHRVVYKVVRAETLPDLSDAVNHAAAEGWRMVPGLLYGGNLVILQKPAAEVKP
jgi:hypothetical protein